MVKIRQATIEDACYIERINQECFENLGEVWSTQAIEFAIVDDSYKIFVAYNEETIVAFITMTYSTYEAYITQMAVSKNYQGNGYGYKILDFVLKNVDSEIFTLEVRSSNLAAISLYEKCGFIKEGLRYSMYENPSEDAIVMTRKEEGC